MNSSTTLASIALAAVLVAAPAAASAQTGGTASPSTAAPPATTSPAPAAAASPQALAGVWTLNRDKSALPGRAPEGDTSGAAPGTPDGRGGGGYGGRHGGGHGGFGGGGGGFGGHGGGGRMGEGGSGRSPEQFEAMRDFIRTQLQPSERMTIVVAADHVSFANADGSTLTLQTNGKKQDGRAENGLVKYSAKSSWDGPALVSEVDVDNGPKVTRRYELSADGAELQITTTMSGGANRRSDGNHPRVIVYERGDGT